MGRYAFLIFNKATTPRYVVMWDLQWQMLECQRLEPATDLSGAIAATIERLVGMGGRPRPLLYGLVFIRRQGRWRLLMRMG